MGRKIKDLSGLQYGRLTVTNHYERQELITFWTCVCSCGNTVKVTRNNLERGATRSCGCLRKELAKTRYLDLEGCVFGNLTVLRLSDEIHTTGKLWNCLCVCGNHLVVRSNKLVYGTIQSCGCINKKRKVKHGMSRTKEFRAMYTRNRDEKKRILDSTWTTEMECALRILFDRCAICSTTDNLSVDHVKPLSKGHGLEPGNAIILCKTCNSAKSAKELDDLPSEWKDKILEASESFFIYWKLHVDNKSVSV